MTGVMYCAHPCKAQTHRPDIKQLVAKWADCCVTSGWLCLCQEDYSPQLTSFWVLLLHEKKYLTMPGGGGGLLLQKRKAEDTLLTDIIVS